MSDQFEMFDLTIFAPIGKPISSPGSAAGRSHSASPDGPTIALCGLVPVLANPIPSRASNRAIKTSATSGPYGSGSSASADLTRSLANKLQMRLDTDGLIEARLTWKAKATRSGRRYCQLAVSARRIGETGCGLWVSPTAQDGTRGNLPARPHDTGVPLSQQVAAMWPTMRSGDGACGQLKFPPRTMNGRLEDCVAGYMWPTPTHRDHRSVLASPETHESNARPLSEMVGATLGLWAMPHSSSTGPGTSGRQGAENIQTQAHGAAQSGSSGPMARRGGLAPDFVAWLMMGNDLGAAVLACAPDKMPKRAK